MITDHIASPVTIISFSCLAWPSYSRTNQCGITTNIPSFWLQPVKGSNDAELACCTCRCSCTQTKIVSIQTCTCYCFMFLVTRRLLWTYFWQNAASKNDQCDKQKWIWSFSYEYIWIWPYDISCYVISNANRSCNLFLSSDTLCVVIFLTHYETM